MNKSTVRFVVAAILLAAAAQIPAADPSAAQKAPTSPIGVEVVYIDQAHGPYPRSITRKTGQFLLIVYNRTSKSVLNFTVQTAAGAQNVISSGSLPGRYLELLINPPRGDYIIQESSRSDWKVKVAIQ